MIVEGGDLKFKEREMLQGGSMTATRGLRLILYY